MNVRRLLIVCLFGGAGTLLVLAGLAVWRQARNTDRWNIFLAGDPRAGAVTFYQKGCAGCHSVLGSGGKLGPDLGLLGATGSSMTELVTGMWNHAPRMWEQIKSSNASYPRFTPEDMANLFAYLYVTCYDDEAGNPDHGQQLFVQKGCLQCHSIGDTGGTIGPNLRDIGPVATPIIWAQTMWNHAPAMELQMRQQNISWPQFEGEEMNDLLSFVRQVRAGPERESEVLPANPRRGWVLFREKGCLSCHAIHGEGGTAGPDLSMGQPVPTTLTRMAARIWNHSPEMWAVMKAKGIERPTFGGQEMADLIAFLYSVRYFDQGGSPSTGQQLFTERKCAQCHGSNAQGGELGPSLRKSRRFFTPVSFALALWSHGPTMYSRAESLGIGWPSLNEGDLTHLLAFLNNPVH
ncbi:MAG TPA: c-type cytochrome [archaeon]|nr:c-type cytochrome [archaeon]